MGQKVNPHGLRVGVIKDWDSRWFASKKDFGDTLVEDYNIRNFIKSQKNFSDAGIPKIEIERFAGNRVRIHIHCAKPGIVIGKGGTEIEELRNKLIKMMGKDVSINIMEVKQPDIDAQLVAEKIAKDLENRISFRRAMKQSIGRAMKLGANHPMGPLELGDFVGLDICLAIMDVLYKETGDSKYRACPLLRKMVRGGNLGVKSGKGFYVYNADRTKTPVDAQ